MNSFGYCTHLKILTSYDIAFFFFTLIKKEKGKHRTFLQTFVHSYSFVIFSSLSKWIHRLAFRYFQTSCNFRFISIFLYMVL
ncbi:hypothetical protein BK727_04360 [Bacillus thuringiensis serovar roskildiensis]|uniref:Uncharacterized protein n=1 Tax=Bacillus thuringiensis serovar sooncheon TaxID=180891 RepID=A0A9Q5SK13_BACTU|nr:hypothetical protein BK707_06720 [Bacillus thuringiensis serovar coreanensis]OTX55242.1 hypothetical protein BK724_01370 [Bacillus thuringiensis serovar sooncheon]OTX58579.1 hypothetical protein BK725_02580 [Bacillus thuringiensis serovar guiyangiensis]OTX72789.1 hypothetical protein BK727_04360 [Bacillus thuringiensis serovar roskildiensis]